MKDRTRFPRAIAAKRVGAGSFLVRSYFPVFALLAIPLLVGSPSPQSNHPEITPLKPPATQYRMGRHLKATGVPNFGEVTSTLYRGGQPTKEGFEALARMGIAIIVDTGRSTRDENLVTNLGMTYVSLPWYCPFPKGEVFAKFIETTKQNPDKKIFVHCRLGDDRTGMMIAAYRMTVEHWTAEEAMEEMHEFGYRGIHHLMCPGLGRYEKSFPKRLQNDPVFENLR